MGGGSNVPAIIGGNPHVGLQKRKVRRDSWTRAKRAAFLDELAASCNVTRACREAGMSRDAAYNLRRRDPVFRAAWTTAIEEGEEVLRAVLISRALGTADADLIEQNARDADRRVRDTPPMSDENCIKMLQIVRASCEGRQGSARWRKPRQIGRSADEVFASLATKLDRVEKRLRRDGKL